MSVKLTKFLRVNDLLAEAINIAAKEHKDQVDRGFRPYILHCLHVMNAVASYGDVYMIVGVLHDLLEDTGMSDASLRRYGFPVVIIEAVVALTRENGCPYRVYIDRICTNPIAARVKLADLKHNCDITRLDVVTQKDLDRLEKYSNAYKYISGYLMADEL